MSTKICPPNKIILFNKSFLEALYRPEDGSFDPELESPISIEQKKEQNKSCRSSIVGAAATTERKKEQNKSNTK